MTPLLACLFPLCTLFGALALLIVILLPTGIGRAGPAAPSAAAEATKPNLPSKWALVIILAVLTVVAGLLGWSTADY